MKIRGLKMNCKNCGTDKRVHESGLCSRCTLKEEIKNKIIKRADLANGVVIETGLFLVAMRKTGNEWTKDIICYSDFDYNTVIDEVLTEIGGI